MLGSRPDLAYSINKLAQYASKPTLRQWKGVKRIIRFVKRTASTTLVLGQRTSNSIKDIHHSIVTGYFDATYMDNSKDRHSTMGYIFSYSGSCVSWASKKQQTIALSMTEAECLAGTEATKESMWIIAFLADISTLSTTPIRLYGDNQGANALAMNLEYYARTKHIHGRQRFLSEMVDQKAIEVVYIPTHDMIADTLTKALPQESYERFMDLIGLQRLQPPNYECNNCTEAFRSPNDLARHFRKTGHDSDLRVAPA